MDASKVFGSDELGQVGGLVCWLVCYIVLMHSAGAACSSMDSVMASASQKSMCFLAFLYFMALIIQKK